MLCTEQVLFICETLTKQVGTMRAKIKYLNFTVYITFELKTGDMDIREVVFVVGIWVQITRDGV